jgi:hypothetical protein
MGCAMATVSENMLDGSADFIVANYQRDAGVRCGQFLCHVLDALIRAR